MLDGDDGRCDPLPRKAIKGRLVQAQRIDARHEGVRTRRPARRIPRRNGRHRRRRTEPLADEIGHDARLRIGASRKQEACLHTGSSPVDRGLGRSDIERRREGFQQKALRSGQRVGLDKGHLKSRGNGLGQMRDGVAALDEPMRRRELGEDARAIQHLKLRRSGIGNGLSIGREANDACGPFDDLPHETDRARRRLEARNLRYRLLDEKAAEPHVRESSAIAPNAPEVIDPTGKRRDLHAERQRAGTIGMEPANFCGPHAVRRENHPFDGQISSLHAGRPERRPHRSSGSSGCTIAAHRFRI